MIKINLNSVKRVFILEDSKDRQEFFVSVFKDINYFMTQRVDVAIKELHTTKYDLILLDHDLDEISIYDEAKPDFIGKIGLPVAQELRNTVNCDTPCIIHSMNPIGASNMVKAHPFNTVHIPYHLLRKALIDEKEKV
jgi:CheY-like chemotaxis protein